MEGKSDSRLKVYRNQLDIFLFKWSFCFQKQAFCLKREDCVSHYTQLPCEVDQDFPPPHIGLGWGRGRKELWRRKHSPAPRSLETHQSCNVNLKQDWEAPNDFEQKTNLFLKHPLGCSDFNQSVSQSTAALLVKSSRPFSNLGAYPLSCIVACLCHKQRFECVSQKRFRPEWNELSPNGSSRKRDPYSSCGFVTHALRMPARKYHTC